MKNETTVKAKTRPRKSPERWPRFFRDMLGQMDVAGDAPVFFAKADIPPETQSHVANLMAQGVLSEEPTNAITCISCDAMAAIRRKGAKGEMASALCLCCGATFIIKMFLPMRPIWAFLHAQPKCDGGGGRMATNA